MTLFDPMDRSLPGSSVHGILQARTLEWVAVPSRDPPHPESQPAAPALQADSLPLSPPWKAQLRGVCVSHSVVFDSFATPGTVQSMEFSRPEYWSGWVAIPFSRGSSQPRDGTRVSCIAGRFFTIRATREAHMGGGAIINDSRVYL